MKQKDILFLLTSTFIIVILWIIFSVYHNSVINTISKSVKMQIIPISPDFDTKTIENLKKRGKISPNYSIENPQASPSGSPTPIPTTPIPTVSPIASQEAQQPVQRGFRLP